MCSINQPVEIDGAALMTVASVSNKINKEKLVSNSDNNNHSLMATFFETRKTYDPYPREHKATCLCETSTKPAHARNPLANGESLIAYIRAPRQSDVQEHLDDIERYCKKNSYQIAHVFTDIGDHPSFGLQAAFDGLENADGLISCNMNMFVKQDGDRIRELRPFIHHFFCLREKHLITITDGIDTGSSFGQENAIALINQTKAGFET